MKMTLKEWAEEYRRVNELEEIERREWLRNLTVEESVRIYQELCRMVANLHDENDPVLWEMRMAYYRDWEEKMQRMARKQGHAIRI